MVYLKRLKIAYLCLGLILVYLAFCIRKHQRPEHRVTPDDETPREQLSHIRLDNRRIDHGQISMESYLIPRKHKVNPHNYRYLIDGSDICKGAPPYLVIVVPTVFSNTRNRSVIRGTWGNASRTGVWPDGSKLPPIRLVFLVGIREEVDVYGILKNESMEHGDIVLVDFIDSYRNLTIKSVSMLHWVITYCPGAKYLLKNDEDAFVHLPGLVVFLEAFNGTSIIGHVSNNFNVTREGGVPKWVVSRAEYPPDVYPPYISGSFYVIGTNLIPKLFHLAEYIPYLSIEDVFVTGILRKIAGFSMTNLPRKRCWNSHKCRSLPPRLSIGLAGIKIYDLQFIWTLLTIKG